MKTGMFVTTACLALGAALAGCDQAKPPSTAAAPATSSAAAATASPGLAPSAVAVNPAPSDAPKGSMTHSPNEAGSALGGTAAGNVTDPKGTTTGGAATGGAAPEPTGGDGTREAAKAEGEAKAAKAGPSN